MENKDKNILFRVKSFIAQKPIASIFLLAILLTLIVVIVVLSNRNKIISIAKKYIGQEETQNNKGFKNIDFQTIMKFAGWYTGAEWCAFFARMVVLKALTGQKRDLAEKLLSGSSQQTFINFKNANSKYFKVSNEPKKGALVIWQSQKNKAKGHAGIVEKLTKNGFTTIEGNTNENGSPGIVAQKEYNTEKEFNRTDLKLRGFIHINS